MSQIEEDIKEEYFEWLYNYVCNGRAHSNVSYKKLFRVLHSIPFIYIIRNDVNRAVDGKDLRNRFIFEKRYDDRNLLYLIRGKCTVLEMIIALAIRCEETIMDDTRYGDRTKQWFWTMLNNLGISNITDEVFDNLYHNKECIETHINKFLYHEYEPNGKGGLFYIRNCDKDLRYEEIWTQLCWYLDSIN